jgi:hypothetical protein
VNKPVLGGGIYRWLFLFQEYDFEFIVKLGKLNVGLDHLLQILTREYAGKLDDILPDAHLFLVQMVDNHFVEIFQYLSTRVAPSDMTVAQKKQLVVQVIDYQLIT